MLNRFNKPKLVRKINKWSGFAFFVAPALIIYSIFMIYPLFGGTFVMSFQKYNVIKNTIKFYGLKNFNEIFVSPEFWNSMIVTLKYTVAVVLITNILALILAMLIESIKLNFFKSLFRNIFFIPYIISGLIIGYLWKFIFTAVWPDLMNSLGLTWLASISWYGDYNMALFALIIQAVWRQLGFLLLLYIAGLQAIPIEVIEASKLDKCNTLQQKIYVVIPMLMSTIRVCLFLSIAEGFKQFDLAFVTQGGPGSATSLLSYEIYKTAFVRNQYGAACAMAIVLMAVIGLVTGVQLRLTRKNEVEL